MVDLNPKRLVFIQEYVRNGGNGKQAAIYAGYSEKTAEVQASRLLSMDKVKEYLNKQQVKLDRDLREIFVEDAIKAYNVLIEIMQKPDAQDKDRLVAARDLLDRAGYKPTEKLDAKLEGDQKLTVSFNIPRPNKVKP